jgi:hypothetical protein
MNILMLYVSVSVFVFNIKFRIKEEKIFSFKTFENL